MGIENIKQSDDWPDRLYRVYSGQVLVVGSGRGVWDDVQQIKDDRHVMTVNDMVTYYPGRVRHGFSNDCVQLPHWFAGRRRAYTQQWGNDTILHTVPAMPSASTSGCKVWPFPPHGSSGLGAVYVVLGLGYEDVLLAGIPLDDSGHFYDPPWIKSNFLREAQERIWLAARDQVFDGRVKSMSGRSREWLGGPS